LSTPPEPNTYYGRDVRFYKGTVLIAHTRSLSVEASAELIKIRSNDSLQPIKVKVGEQTFKWSIEHLFVGKDFMADFIAGSVSDIVLAPDGDDEGTDTETWKNSVITNVGRKTAEGFIENVSGESTPVTFPEVTGGGT
jgi:hypothetical protein